MPELSDLYKPGMRPEELAACVLGKSGMDMDNPRLPIDPFSLMRSCGIVYQFMDAKKLEGVYILPKIQRTCLWSG